MRSEGFETSQEESTFSDSLNKEASEGFTFNVLGFKGASTLFDRLVFARAMDTFRPFGICSVLGGALPKDLVPETVLPQTADEWSEKTVPGAKIVSMQLSESGNILRGEQWKKLSSVLLNSTEKSLIILIDTAYGFSADVDNAAFSSMLEKAAENKNVFVVYNDDKNFCRIENGVRYISVASSKEEKVIGRAIENTKYLSFDITPDGATYSFKKLYH